MKETPQPPSGADGFIRFSCEQCGRSMQARAETVGRKTQCPGCKTFLTIPSQSAAAPAPPRKRGSSGLVVGLVVVVLGLALGAVVAWYVFGRGKGLKDAGGDLEDPTKAPPAEVDDYQLLPGEAQVVGSVRIADLWNRPEARKALEEARKKNKSGIDPALEVERQTGLTPDQIQRLHVVVLDQAADRVYAALRTVAPIDRAKVLSKATKRERKTHRGKQYFSGLSVEGKQGALWFASQSVLVLGNEASVQLAIEQLETPRKQGKLAATLALIRENKHHGVAGYVPAVGAIPKGGPADQAAALLQDAKLISGTLNVAEKATLSIDLEGSDKKKTTQARQQLTAGLNLLKVGLRTGFGMPAELGEKERETLADLLDELKISQKEATITVRLEVEESKVMGALADLMSQQQKK